MEFKVLGCHGAELAGRHSCGFLVNRTVLLDAGTVCSSLNLSEQRNIRHILISHIHMDHIKDLAFLSENLVAKKRRKPVVIIGLKEVLAGLRKNLFNNQIWPDFTKLPDRRNPVFRLKPVREGKPFAVDGLQVTAYRVNHIVPCSGFLIRGKDSSVLYSGDTHQTDSIWRAAAGEPRLKAALIETSFPNDLEKLAAGSKHLTPKLLKEEFSKIGKPRLPLYVYHIKPVFHRKVCRELRRLKIPNLRILMDGQALRI